MIHNSMYVHMYIVCFRKLHELLCLYVYIHTCFLHPHIPGSRMSKTSSNVCNVYLLYIVSLPHYHSHSHSLQCFWSCPLTYSCNNNMFRYVSAIYLHKYFHLCIYIYILCNFSVISRVQSQTKITFKHHSQPFN